MFFNSEESIGRTTVGDLKTPKTSLRDSLHITSDKTGHNEPLIGAMVPCPPPVRQGVEPIQQWGGASSISCTLVLCGNSGSAQRADSASHS